MTPALHQNMAPPPANLPGAPCGIINSLAMPNQPFPGFLSARPDLSDPSCFGTDAPMPNPGSGPLHPQSCHGCLLPIVDNVYLSVADYTTWHVPCLRCSDCSVGLDSEKSCFIKIGKYLCKKCYQRLENFQFKHFATS